MRRTPGRVSVRRGCALALALVAALCPGTRVHAQTEPFARVGSYGFLSTGEIRGARNLGMGLTGTADMTDLATGTTNPAALAWRNAYLFQANRREWRLDADLLDLRVSGGHVTAGDSVSGRWRFGAALAYAFGDMPPQPIRTITQPEGTGEFFTPEDHSIEAAFAAGREQHRLAVSAGASARYQWGGFLDDDVAAWVFDVGAVAATPLPVGGGLIRPRLGAAVRNLDTGVDYDGKSSKIRNHARLGAGLDVETSPTRVGDVIGAPRTVPLVAFALDADWVEVEDSDGYMAIGGEVSLARALQVRFGWNDDNPGEQTTWGLGLGWEFGAWRLQVDYASVTESENEIVPEDTYHAGALTIGGRW